MVPGTGVRCTTEFSPVEVAKMRFGTGTSTRNEPLCPENNGESQYELAYRTSTFPAIISLREVLAELMKPQTLRSERKTGGASRRG
jgi:hypothetical protein